MKLFPAATVAAGIASIIFAGSCGRTAEPDLASAEYASLVDPFIGTDYTGNTYPGAQLPFGMVQLSPDNGTGGWDRIAGYYYPDSTIAGFSHTHLSGTGAGDLYDISFMPVAFPIREAQGELGIHSRFSHDSELAEAGYYAVKLDDYGVGVELTATERCGIQRYAMPAGRVAVIVNLSKAMNWDATTASDIAVVDSVTVEGFRFSDGWARDQRLWFRTRFSQPWDSISVERRPTRSGVDGMPQESATAWFYFDLDRPDTIVVATALSCTGPEGAALNLAAEAPHNDFDTYRTDARRRWNMELGRVRVDSADAVSPADRVKFYTALYHSMLAPTIYGDVDGSYRGPDKRIHRGFINRGSIHRGSINRDSIRVNYGTFSLWDTYRAAHPLYTILMPGRAADMAASLVEFGEQNGRLPVWNFQGSETDMMIGYHSAPVIADALLKGLLDAPQWLDRALDLCVATARRDDYREIGLYRRFGYVPYDLATSPNNDGSDWSLSKTLEYAYDDHCIALLAEMAGRKEIAAEFRERSKNYNNLFNSATGFFQPRDSKGEFQPDFNPEAYTDHICESNAWHYLWSVQHDVPGLVGLLGGKEAMAARLEQLMTTAPGDSSELPIFSTGMIGQYAHGNEPSHHVIYLNNAAGHPERTARYVSKVVEEFYDTTPAGLCGNEDCGQMSAWFVFSALGFYPVDPLSGVYEIGTPLFRRASLELEDGRVFTVEAPGLSKENIYVGSATLDGVPLEGTSITYDRIKAGGTLRLEMKGR